jgi:cytoskeleton protein RodZ
MAGEPTVAADSADATQTTADTEGTPPQAPTAAETTSASEPAFAGDEDAAVVDQTQTTDDTDQASAEAASAEEELAPTPASDGVDLSFTGPCWVDIRDAKGSVLLFGEMARGDKETLAGEPPFSFVIGNAAAVEMNVGGMPYDVRAVARGNVARFEIDPRNLDAATPIPETTD